jgi:hypothetical protein
MYVWDGILRPNGDKKEEDDGKADLKWEGAWVSSEASDAKKVEPPKRHAFADMVNSEMHFHVSGTAVKIVISEGTEAEEAPDDTKTTLYKLSLTEGPGWDMKDEEDDTKKTKHQDEVHDVLLPNLKWSGDLHNQLIFAKGKNAHGDFVSAGWMRPGNRLTLARRYLEEGDPRVEWQVHEVRNNVLEEIYDVETDKIRIPPWQCSIMNTTLTSSASGQKRSHEDEEGGGDEEGGNGDKKAKGDVAEG